MYLFRKYCTSNRQEFFPYSTIKTFNKHVKQSNISKYKQSNCDFDNNLDEYRENELKIQMISQNLYRQIFGSSVKIMKDKLEIEKRISELHKYGLKVGESPKMPEVSIKLPKLKGKCIEEHFNNIAREQCQPFNNLAQTLLEDMPRMPNQWSFKYGWTRYNKDGTFKSVDFPEDNAIVFDVEVCLTEGLGPILACAVGKNYWYSWASLLVTNLNSSINTKHKKKFLDMIPLGKAKPKLIVGHNVSYDRARIKEQYLLEDTGARFLDTMSLHVCVSGITSYQRAILKSKRDLEAEELTWSTQSSLNSLAEVYNLYCKKKLQKEERDIFVKGNLTDVQENFQLLMSYCAKDVLATQNILQMLYPLFQERFPHPATLAGMLEIGKDKMGAFIPTTSKLAILQLSK